MVDPPTANHKEAICIRSPMPRTLPHGYTNGNSPIDTSILIYDRFVSEMPVHEQSLLGAVKLRPADANDARAIAEVHVLSWQSAYRGLVPQHYLDGLSIERREAIWSSSFAKGEVSVLVAEVKARLVGFSAFGPCRDVGAQSNDREIWAIYVAPDHWSTGVGRLLWLESRQAMVARRANRIILWMIAGNDRAARFYTAAGFKVDAGSVKQIEIGGAQVREVRYALQIGA